MFFEFRHTKIWKDISMHPVFPYYFQIRLFHDNDPFFEEELSSRFIDTRDSLVFSKGNILLLPILLLPFNVLRHLMWQRFSAYTSKMNLAV